MIAKPDCPVCAANDFDEVGRRTYRREEMDTATQSCRRRLEVLFDVWLDGADEFPMIWQMCRQCGMVIYSPRPTADDLDRKYQYLTQTESEHQEAERQSLRNETDEIERRRAERMGRKLTVHLASADGAAPQVLDFGGGDGRLVQPLAKAGAECFVVDYVEECIPSVTRLAQTLEELDPDRTFDMVICSHVLEHVADPLSTLTRLRQQTREGGIGYFEVPIEIWKSPPNLAEPVTHVNFYTLQSFGHLCRRGGFTPISLKFERAPHSAAGHSLVIAALVRAEKASAGTPPPSDAAEQTRRLLNPGVREWIARSRIHPSILPNAVWHKLKRYLPK